MARPPTGQVIQKRGERGTTYAIRFRAYGTRRYVTLGATADGWDRRRAEIELENALADVRRGIWTPPPAPTAVEEPPEEPTFHVLASEWVERRRHEVDDRTVEHWKWALSIHLLPFFADSLPSEIDAALVERYKTSKLRERERRQIAFARWEKEPRARRRKRPAPGLGNASINKTLKVLAQVLDDAVEYGYAESNVARGKRRRLKASRPKRTWLELHEVQALLGTAGTHRALIATMVLAGLRVGEVVALRWRDVDLAAGKLRVDDAKTEAGERTVELSPSLLGELKLHRANRTAPSPDDFVFGTSRRSQRNRSNLTRQILAPAVRRANAELVEAGRNPLEGITNHSLRRTFCALLYEAGASPAYVMAQMGHSDASLALEIYAKVVDRKRDTGARMDALIHGADWAPMGTNPDPDSQSLPVTATKNPPERAFR
jgi:integrase